MLMRARMVILLFSVSLGLLLFFAGREMFGPNAGLLARGQPTAALTFAKTAASQYPNDADIQATLAQALMATGQTAEGQKALDQAVRLAQTNHPEYQRFVLDEMLHP